MSQDQLKDREAESLYSAASRITPAILIGGSALYALGLYAAFRMDALLGVGAIQVPRERAVSLGIVQLFLLLPLILFWLTIRDTLSDCSEVKLISRLKSVGLAIILPALSIILLVVLAVAVLGVSHTESLILSTSIPLLSIAFLLLHSSSNARRIVYGWPLFLALSAPIPALSLSSWLLYSFGGHVGPQVLIRMKDTSTYSGRLKAMDTSVVVIFVDSKNVSISRSEILVIEQLKRPD